MRPSILLALMAAVVSAQADRLRVCYYSNWSQYRPGVGKFFPKDIPADLCTHLMYSFAKMNSKYELAMYERNDDVLYKEFNSLRTKNPNLRTLLAIGGWNMGSREFSNMVTLPEHRSRFARTAVTFLRTWGFDGLDLDWEYPANRAGSRKSDKANFIKLLEDVKKTFAEEDNAPSGQNRLLLTAAVAAGKSTVDSAYDIPSMAKYLDFINLMSYDLNGAWSKQTGHNSPLHARAAERGDQATLNIEWAANYWVKKGIPKEKLIIGLATYGRTFTLANPSVNGFGAPATGTGRAGTQTREAGFLAYYEICKKMETEGVRHWDDESKVPYLVAGNQSIGYDDRQSFINKLTWIRDEGFGGAMLWNIDLDDFKQICSSSKKSFPLTRLIEEVFGGYVPPSTSEINPPTAQTNPPTEQANPPTEETNPPTEQTSPTTDSTNPSTGQTISPTVQTNPPHTEPPNTSFCMGMQDGFYRDPQNCQAFYQCYNSGHTARFVCTDGLLYNPLAKACDYKHNVDCSGPVVPTRPPTNPPTNPPTKSPTTDTPTTEPPSTNPPPINPLTNPTKSLLRFCQDKADGLYAFPNACEKFYNCGNGVTYVLACAPGTLFDPNIGNCDWHYNVECGSRPKP